MTCETINEARTIAANAEGNPSAGIGTPMDKSIGDGPTMRPKEERIGRGAFWGCLRLSRVELPASLEEIGEKAFLLCRSLERIVYHGTKEEWDAVRKGESWDERVFANVPELTVEFLKS